MLFECQMSVISVLHCSLSAQIFALSFHVCDILRKKYSIISLDITSLHIFHYVYRVGHKKLDLFER